MSDFGTAELLREGRVVRVTLNDAGLAESLRVANKRMENNKEHDRDPGWAATPQQELDQHILAAIGECATSIYFPFLEWHQKYSETKDYEVDPDIGDDIDAKAVIGFKNRLICKQWRRLANGGLVPFVHDDWHYVLAARSDDVSPIVWLRGWLTGKQLTQQELVTSTTKDRPSYYRAEHDILRPMIDLMEIKRPVPVCLVCDRPHAGAIAGEYYCQEHMKEAWKRNQIKESKEALKG